MKPCVFSASAARKIIGRCSANGTTIDMQCKSKTFLTCRRRLSSLGSPMFPQMPITESNIPKIAVPKGEEDFLTRHGGKVAAAAIALTAAILYTYYESGRSKTYVEDKLNDQMVIEPYEVNEIRFLNHLTPSVYDALVVACMEQFSSSPATQQGVTEATYPEFVTFVQHFLANYNEQKHLDLKSAKSDGEHTEKSSGSRSVGNETRHEYVLKSGHLFDRLMTQYILSGRDKSEDIVDNGIGVSVIGGSTQHVQASPQVASTKISAMYMLVAVNMALRANAEIRVETLFNAAQLLSRNDINCGDANELIDGVETIGGSDSVTDKESRTVSDSGVEKVEDDLKKGTKSYGKSRTALKRIGRNPDEVEEVKEEVYVSLAATEQIVMHLANSWQVPNEKRVGETGIRYPIKTYREKTAQEMVQSHREMLKPPHTADKLSKAEFRELLLGNYVCVWAECYRGRR